MNQMNDMKICQSCAMPLQTDADHGTEADGAPSADYCCYCYERGAFVGGEQTMDEAIESCVAPCLEAGVYPNAEAARAAMKAFFPQLKRWRKDA